MSKISIEEFKKLGSPQQQSAGIHRTFMTQCKAMKLPKPTAEHRFHPTRQWRFDFCWPDQMIAVEIEGGLFIQGGHSRGRGYEKDLEKYNEATKLGWAVYRFSTDSVKNGKAVAFLEGLKEFTV